MLQHFKLNRDSVWDNSILYFVAFEHKILIIIENWLFEVFHGILFSLCQATLSNSLWRLFQSLEKQGISYCLPLNPKTSVQLNCKLSLALLSSTSKRRIQFMIMGKEAINGGSEKSQLAHTVEQLIAVNPYNPDILPDLENYVNEQVH